MAREITLAEVEEAEAALLDAKKRRKTDPEALKTQANKTAQIRQAFRTQETEAGRRAMVGGDARKD